MARLPSTHPSHVSALTNLKAEELDNILSIAFTGVPLKSTWQSCLEYSQKLSLQFPDYTQELIGHGLGGALAQQVAQSLNGTKCNVYNPVMPFLPSLFPK